jgi:hypothetical protein
VVPEHANRMGMLKIQPLFGGDSSGNLRTLPLLPTG